ncbi:hypothetical protein HYC85_014456 [Camellia sinensis]|uniref:Centromere/kinetochore protein zw10 N-terminal domain-containing protein n=1 Tax=Camellia sinensis TaxID=4442 RepID=A0A7J7H6J5_CAMSI|nr:hypothetical protein HYC85_014456 [Camellia sinensis]
MYYKTGPIQFLHLSWAKIDFTLLIHILHQIGDTPAHISLLRRTPALSVLFSPPSQRETERERSSMDVLFNSIDVRDLLSSHDLDDSSPLSATDLRLLIDRLQVHSLHIKSKVRDYILSHHHDFSSLFAQCPDAVSNSEQLSGQLSDLLRLISDHPIDVEIRDVVAEN